MIEVGEEGGEDVIARVAAGTDEIVCALGRRDVEPGPIDSFRDDTPWREGMVGSDDRGGGFDSGVDGRGIDGGRLDCSDDEDGAFIIDLGDNCGFSVDLYGIVASDRRFSADVHLMSTGVDLGVSDWYVRDAASESPESTSASSSCFVVLAECFFEALLDLLELASSAVFRESRGCSALGRGTSKRASDAGGTGKCI